MGQETEVSVGYFRGPNAFGDAVGEEMQEPMSTYTSGPSGSGLGGPMGKNTIENPGPMSFGGNESEFDMPELHLNGGAGSPKLFDADYNPMPASAKPYRPESGISPSDTKILPVTPVGPTAGGGDNRDMGNHRFIISKFAQLARAIFGG